MSYTQSEFDQRDSMSKSSLQFILDGNHQFHAPHASSFSMMHSPTKVYMHQEPATAEEMPPVPTRAVATGSKSNSPRPANRVCKVDDCNQYVVDKGLCVKHGGGKRCIEHDCNSRAKHYGRCWKHGGSTQCMQPGCENRAKSRRLCWSHGGGTKCKDTTCDKIAISKGLCWAHGGGKRCIKDGCLKQAYERTDNLCTKHFNELPQDEEMSYSVNI